MHYLIIGAGGTGACLGGFLSMYFTGEIKRADAASNVKKTCSAGQVTFIARGEHLYTMQQQGLRVHSDIAREAGLTDELHINAPAMAAEDFNGKADIIFVCVKAYSLAAVLPLIRRAAHKDTLIIPVLNMLDASDRMAQAFPHLKVLGGCIYIAAEIAAPGVIAQHGKVFRVVYGPLDQRVSLSELAALTEDLTAARIRAVVSSDIRSDIFRKYSFISPLATAGAFHQATAGQLRQEGAARKTFLQLTEEIDMLAHASGIKLEIDIRTENEKMLAAMVPDFTSSLQKDIAKGGMSEIDGQIFAVVRLARQAGLALPTYERIANSFGFNA